MERGDTHTDAVLYRRAKAVALATITVACGSLQLDRGVMMENDSRTPVVALLRTTACQISHRNTKTAVLHNVHDIDSPARASCSRAIGLCRRLFPCPVFTRP